MRKLIIPAVILGVLLIVVAVVYFAEPESSLPSFFPGHAAGSSHHHTKHGIAALIVALACFAFAWFQSGPKTQST
jgi:hypothetical protein